jgi:hypothetical protein
MRKILPDLTESEIKDDVVHKFAVVPEVTEKERASRSDRRGTGQLPQHRLLMTMSFGSATMQRRALCGLLRRLDGRPA